MESLINLDSVNFYSKLEYNSKKSVLDAAFGLLGNENFTYTEKNFEYINSFIIFIYSIICINLISQSDDGMLNLAGDFTDIKIFAYNLIYMYDNIYNYNENYINLYNNNDFNYIIDEFITNRCDENQLEFDENYFSEDLVSYVEEAYMDNSLLIQTEIIQDSSLKDWQICLYITVYYFILLVNDITNEKRKTGPLLFLKTLNYILFISYSINILTTINENDEIELFTFLENNSYFNIIYSKINEFFFNNHDGNFNYDILNYLVEIPDILEIVQSLSSRILNASIETTTNLYVSLRIALINLNLDNPSTINAQNNLYQIVKKINAEYDSFPLIEFYDNVLFTISENINSDIISNITETVNEYNYLKNIYISNLENVFDTFIYNFLFYKNTGEYTENIKYLCDNINNIYKNKLLYNVFWDILFDTQQYAEYFFEHKINFYRKSLLIEGIDNFNNEDQENEEDEPCYDDFHLKYLNKLQNFNSDEDNFEYYDNLQIGHSILGRKYNLQIPLTKKLFFTDVCYCGNQINLDNFPDFFNNNEC